MQFSRPEAKYGITGGVPTCTKQGVVVFGGHSGMGMLQASEMARSGGVDYVMTVSKRGKPSAPGPASAFVAAMADVTTHYMAACDESDQKAVECLLDWQPPIMPEVVSTDNTGQVQGFEETISTTKAEMHSMSPAQLTRSLELMQDLRLQIASHERAIKAQLQHMDFAKERDNLHEQQLYLQEQETAVLELIAELTSSVNAQTGVEIEGE